MANDLYNSFTIDYETDEIFEPLIGHPILEVAFNEDFTILRLNSFGRFFYYIAYGSCCSESWFNHFENVEAMYAGLISYEMIDGEECTEGSRQEVDRVYFVKFVTTTGMATLELRNASNGYYGGNVYRLNPSEISEDIVFTKVTEDF